VYFDDWSFRVHVRTTILDNPTFYARARGGFGGVRAAPGRTYTPAHPTLGGAHPGGSGHSGRAYSGASPHVSGHGGG
jgi:hypothetical protein